VPRSLYYLLSLRKNQWKKPSELKKIQSRRLTKLMKFAYEKVPFWQERFVSNNLKPTDIQKAEDLKKLPILTKKDMVTNSLNKTVARGVDSKKCRIDTTSGSTGLVLTVFQNRQTLDYSTALIGYALTECGLKATDKLVELRAFTNPVIKFWYRQLGLFKKIKIPLQQLMEDIISQLNKIKPEAIYAYPSFLHNLALFSQEKPGSVRFRPRIVFSHGEVLYNFIRKEVISLFDCDIRNLYGSAEFNRIAFECEKHNGLHVISDSHIIEFINDKELPLSKGEGGRIVVTSLYNRTRPFIRYNLGDIGVPNNRQCPCGRSWPLMKNIVGREDDCIILPSGRMISPMNVNVLEYLPGITKYRIIQKKPDELVVQVVVDSSFSKVTVAEIKQNIVRGCLREKVSVQVEVVNDIPSEKSGKIRTVISEVRLDSK